MLIAHQPRRGATSPGRSLAHRERHRALGLVQPRARGGARRRAL